MSEFICKLYLPQWALKFLNIVLVGLQSRTYMTLLFNLIPFTKLIIHQTLLTYCFVMVNMLLYTTFFSSTNFCLNYIWNSCFIFSCKNPINFGRSDLEAVLNELFDYIFSNKQSEPGTASHLESIDVFINAANFSKDDGGCAMSFEDFKKWCTLLPSVRKFLGSLLRLSDSGHYCL